MKFRTFTILMTALLTGGCIWPRSAQVSTAGAEAPAEPSFSIGPQEGLMVVYFRAAALENASQDIEACVEQQIRARLPKQHIVSYEEFRRAAFPQLDAASAPRHPSYLEILFDDANFRSRVSFLGVRWIVFVSGTSSSQKENFGVGGGPVLAAGGTTNKWTSLGAAIVSVNDLSRGQHLGTSANGKQFFAAGAIGGAMGGVPFLIFLPVTTEGPACRALGQQVASRIAKLSGQEEIP